MSPPPIYEFADIRVDTARMLVVKDGRVVAIEPKTFDVFRFLIEHRDRVVMKDELLEAVWRDTFVTPNVLTRAIAQLRKAIGDDARESRYIETIATRGYRFIAPVTEVSDASVVPVAVELPGLAPPVGPPAVQAGPRASRLRLAGIAALLVIAAATGVTLLTRSPRRPAGSAEVVTSIPEVQRLVGSNAGYVSQPSFSPDGQAIAYVSDKTGPLEIYVVGLAPGSREIAITSDGQQNAAPAWSPDGQWIAYESKGRGGIWIVPATGGTPRQITESGSDPAWSPDSQEIAYASYGGALAAQGNLWIVRRDGSNPRPLTRVGMPNGGHHQPAWSRDGRFIVFVLYEPQVKSSLWIVSVAGGQPRQLRIQGAVLQANPQFSFDDRTLYWSGTTPNVNERIWKVALTDDYDVAGAATPVLAIDGIADGLSVARDGRAVYGVHSEDSNLWAIDVRDGNASREPVRLTSGQRSYRASYSVNGRIAYVKVNTGTPPSIWTIKEDGTDEQPMVTDFPAAMPQWLRDGSRLLVAEQRSENANTDDRLWWVDAATRRTTAIPLDLHGIAEPRISPDGKTLAFHVIDPSGAVQVWTQPIDGGARRLLTRASDNVSFVSWSPDGKWLSVELTRNDETDVGAVASGGGEVERLTNDHGQSWPSTWSPDDEWIAYAGERGNVWNLWTVSRRTKQQHQLTHFASASGYVRWPAWSPRGDRIVFERDIWTGNVWLMTAP